MKDGKILGKGHNKVTLEKLCNPCIRKLIKDNSRVELCSAIHAEQMAIIDVVNGGGKLSGARMYHVKIKNGEVIPVGDLSCTVCGRIICEANLEFVLFHKDGYALYESEEINRLSFDYFIK